MNTKRIRKEHKERGDNMQTNITEFPLSIPIELRDFLTVRAKQRGIPRNALITNLLWEYKEKFEYEQKNR